MIPYPRRPRFAAGGPTDTSVFDSANTFYHVDASVASSMTTAGTDAEGRTLVSALADVRGAGYPTSSNAGNNMPWIDSGALNGRNVLDFGSFASGTAVIRTRRKRMTSSSLGMHRLFIAIVESPVPCSTAPIPRPMCGAVRFTWMVRPGRLQTSRRPVPLIRLLFPDEFRPFVDSECRQEHADAVRVDGNGRWEVLAELAVCRRVA